MLPTQISSYVPWSPKRDSRVHKPLFPPAPPVFKDMFSLPRPTSDDSTKSAMAKVEVVEITDSADVLDIVPRTIYPSFTPPSLDGDFDFGTRGMPGHRR